MKKLLLTLALAVGAINSGFATDLYVNNSGQSGTYTTINGALAASSSGDRIFVSPMNFYAEDLTITKSITLAPTNSGSKISLDGRIAIQVIPGLDITIVGVECDAIQLSPVMPTATLTNTASLNIVSCKVLEACELRANGLLVYIHDSKFSGELRVKYCEMTKSIVQGYLRISPVDNIGTANTNDTIRLVANWLSNFEYDTHNYHLFCSNNYFDGACLIYRMPGIGISGRSIFQNNYHRGNFQYLIDPTKNSNWSHLDIYNSQIPNIFSMYARYYSYNGTNLNYYSTTQYFASANTSTNSYPYNWGNTGNVTGSKTPNVLYCQVSLPNDNGNGQGNSFFPIENLTGISSNPDLAGSLHYNTGSNPITLTDRFNVENPDWINQFSDTYVDLGSPASNFTDLDLSRNDIGILGGSHSWLNYWYNETSTTGNAVIRWIDLPSEIWPGQTVNLKAEAVHTN